MVRRFAFEITQEIVCLGGQATQNSQRRGGCPHGLPCRYSVTEVSCASFARRITRVANAIERRGLDAIIPRQAGHLD
jgi:hypothetical protein